MNSRVEEKVKEQARLATEIEAAIEGIGPGYKVSVYWKPHEWRIVLAALRSTEQVCVPREPTREMLSALCGHPLVLAASMEEAARIAYAAMLSAAPHE